jgi:hypothetical protein
MNAPFRVPTNNRTPLIANSSSRFVYPQITQIYTDFFRISWRLNPRQSAKFGDVFGLGEEAEGFFTRSRRRRFVSFCQPGSRYRSR